MCSANTAGKGVHDTTIPAEQNGTRSTSDTAVVEHNVKTMNLRVRPSDDFTCDHPPSRWTSGRFYVRPCAPTMDHQTISRATIEGSSHPGTDHWGGFEGGHRTKVAHRTLLRPTACSTAEGAHHKSLMIGCMFYRFRVNVPLYFTLVSAAQMGLCTGAAPLCVSLHWALSVRPLWFQ